MSESATIPVAPGAVPLLGHLPRLARNPLRFLDTLSGHGELQSLRLGRKNMLVVCDPELSHQMLVADDVFDKGGPFFDAAGKMMPTAMGFVRHDQHRRLRRLMQPSFSRGRMPGYGEIMTEQVAAAAAGWQDGRILDIGAELTAITVRIFAATMFSTSVSEDMLREISQDSLAVIRGVLVEMAVPSPLSRLVPGHGRFRKAVARLRATALKVIAERRAEGEAATEHRDLLSTLLTASADDDRFSDSEIVDQISLLLVAGSEVTAQTVAWALYELSRRPELEAQVQAEVDEVLAGRPAGYDDIPRLEVLGRLLSEVLRFYSPSWVLTRATSADTELGGYRIPAGTDLLFSPYIIDRAPASHEQAREFDPDRWLPERAACMHARGNIPFGTGARKCIADQFAQTECALILATIVSRWSMTAVPGNKLGTNRKIVNSANNLRLRAVRRVS